MIRILTTLGLLASMSAPGQSVRVDTLHVPQFIDGVPTQTETIMFPMVRTGNRKLDTLINADLKNRFTRNEYRRLPTRLAITKWAKGIIIDVDFEVTYRKNGLLSMQISGEGCGANCSSWKQYYTYSTITGKFVALADIIDTTGAFKKLVLTDNARQYKQQSAELKAMLADKEADLDQEDYDWALERYNECERSFEFNSFALYEDRIEIITECDFPNVSKNLTPVIDLTYKYRDISKYLKRKDLAITNTIRK